MSAAAFLSPRLLQLAGKLQEALSRAQKQGDEEAIHDLRVVLRRLRSLLKPARGVYGAFHTEAVRAALKTLSDATGELRDEEVLQGLIGALPLGAADRKERAAWLRHRKEREDTLRAGVGLLLQSGGGARALTLLSALLALPVDPARDHPLAEFAARAVRKAEARVRALGDVPLASVEKLHTLRILYKRLRYAAEGFLEALPPELAALAAGAERFQKRLGDVHDVDVAMIAVGADPSLGPELRGALQSALQQARVRCIEKYTLEKAAQSASASASTSEAARAAGAPGATGATEDKARAKGQAGAKGQAKAEAKAKGQAGAEARAEARGKGGARGEGKRARGEGKRARGGAKTPKTGKG